MLNKGHGTKRKTVSELIDDALTWKLVNQVNQLEQTTVKVYYR